MVSRLSLALSGLLVGGCISVKTNETGDADPYVCEVGGGGNSMSDFKTELEAVCLSDLREPWVLDEALWNLGHFTDSESVKGAYTQSQAEEILRMLGATYGSDELARHELALLAAGLLANLEGLLDMETACGEFSQWSKCALNDYSGLECNPAGPPPPPKGDDPQDFCDEVLNISGSAFSCFASPLSQALTFASVNTGVGEPANLWLTVTPAAGTAVDRIWWPVWLAAYASDAPSMLTFTATDSAGKSVAGVLVAHSIQLSVTGPSSEVAKFWSFVNGQLTGASPSSPTWSKLKIALPSSLRYQVITGLSSSSPSSTEVLTWKPGEPLLLPGGSSVAWKFDKLVGIIDPCRVPKDREATGTTGKFCELRAESWTGLVKELEDAGMDQVFNTADICP